MRAIPRNFLVASALLAATSVHLQAHPGHSHTDIPGLIRHPFAGPEHLLGSAACGVVLAGVLYWVTRRVPMPALVRWTGLSLVAIGVTWVAPM